MNHSTRWAAEPCVQASSVDLALRLLLDPVVADRLGGRDGLLDVLPGELEEQRLATGVLGLGGGARPHAGVAVGLELEAYGVALRALLRADLAHGAHQVLDVVAVLVRQHVGLDEAAVGSAQLLLEHAVEERRVEVDLESAGQ